MALATDSFCERCGNRYVFSPSAPKPLSLKGARVLAKGLRNFVLTDGQSMSDAISLARLDDDREASSRIDQAFHKTFNFCMTCRQYACDSCWNSKVGACLTCAPEDGIGAAAPEENPIARIPVARPDGDRQQEPEGGAPGQQGNGSYAWPAQDVRAGSEPAAASQSQGPNRPRGRGADPEAWTLWPVADQIAPEMTLTPEELAMVEAELDRAQGPQSITADSTVVEETIPAVVAPAQVVEEKVSADEAALVAENPAAAAEEPAESGSATPTWVSLNVEPRASAQAVDETDVAAEPEAVVANLPEPSLVPDPSLASELDQSAAIALPVEIEALTDERAADLPDGIEADSASAARPRRVLRMSLADPALPPLTASASTPEPQSVAKERRPMVARLFGRGAPNASAGSPWPHPTLWADRPTTINDWWGDAEAAAVVDSAPGVASQAASSAPTPELEDAPVVVPAPAEKDAPAAALAQTADAELVAGPAAAAIPDPAAAPAPVAVPAEAPKPEPASDLAPPMTATPDLPSPADAQEAMAMRLSAVAGDSEGTAEPTELEPSAPAAWPPLGAQWPSPQRPSQPWPAPVVAPVAAVVAAQRLGGAPSVAEMWAQSAQEVVSRGSVRVCQNCALPVSTHARFCRRCGTPQA